MGKLNQQISAPIPAAQYVRMSDESQQYSIENQKAAIQDYAARYGFVIVKTYDDPGRSGVVAAHRKGLSQLLRDVVGGNPPYKAIIVYDVSRWGRFQDTDESAHYEFLCKSAGVPIHYSAEPFANDGTATSTLLKALKRSMAAEFSRELSDKVTRGKTRIVRLGYWVGGQAGFGYRRLMLSEEGKPKRIMKSGEYKHFTKDRVILVHGPRREVNTVRLMFDMAIEGKGGTAIADELNRRKIPCSTGRLWASDVVRHMIMNPKYAGWNVWKRSSERLQQKRTPIPPEQWIAKQGAFKPIVDQETYDRAQACRPKIADERWSDSEILSRVRRLLKSKGSLSENLIRKARGMPSTTTIHAHFGRYLALYEKVGYQSEPEYVLNSEQFTRAQKLRKRIVTTIQSMFPDKITITHLPRGQRALLLVDNNFMVSILLCRSKVKRGAPRWVVEPHPKERGFITLACTLSERHDDVLGYFLLPNMNWFKRALGHDSFLQTGVQLHKLTDFYTEVKKLSAARAGQHLPVV
ncbi:MAG TPA: recombinase family protein [Candidatus Binatia bacterium]|nr:recombinase family protein [Candidatus Binatia bacterium]